MNACKCCSKKKSRSYSYGSTGESPNQANNATDDDCINQSDDSDNENADWERWKGPTSGDQDYMYQQATASISVDSKHTNSVGGQGFGFVIGNN